MKCGPALNACPTIQRWHFRPGFQLNHTLAGDRTHIASGGRAAVPVGERLGDSHLIRLRMSGPRPTGMTLLPTMPSAQIDFVSVSPAIRPVGFTSLRRPHGPRPLRRSPDPQLYPALWAVTRPPAPGAVRRTVTPVGVWRTFWRQLRLSSGGHSAAYSGGTNSAGARRSLRVPVCPIVLLEGGPYEFC